MSAYANVDLPEPFGPMIACFSFVFSERSTPLTISVPSSSATCRFVISSSATLVLRLQVSKKQVRRRSSRAHAYLDGSRTRAGKPHGAPLRPDTASGRDGRRTDVGTSA